MFKRTLLACLFTFSMTLQAAPLPNCMRDIDKHIGVVYDCGLGMKFRLPIFDKCQLHDKDMPALVAWLNNHPQIQAVELPDFGLTDKGAAAFSGANYIQWLNLTGNYIEHVDAIAKMPALHYLLIRSNQISSTQPFVGNTQLKYLDIASNRIDSAGAEILASIPTLTEIFLDNNEIDDSAMPAFANAQALTNLYLDDNNIGPAGAAALANQAHITDLGLNYNHIGDQGAIALSTNTTLRWLYVAYNQIGQAGLAALEADRMLIMLGDSGNGNGEASKEQDVKMVQLHPHNVSGGMIIKTCEKR